MLLTRRIHPVLGREELRLVGHSGGESSSSAAPEGAPRRCATLPGCPTVPALADPYVEKQECWSLFCQPSLGALKCENEQKLWFSFYDEQALSGRP